MLLVLAALSLRMQYMYQDYTAGGHQSRLNTLTSASGAMLHGDLSGQQFLKISIDGAPDLDGPGAPTVARTPQPHSSCCTISEREGRRGEGENQSRSERRRRGMN